MPRALPRRATPMQKLRVGAATGAGSPATGPSCRAASTRCHGPAPSVILAPMPPFQPVNPLESLLRKLLSGEDGRVWQFLTPLAAAPVWLITKHYPELDGSDLVAPEGQNPAFLSLEFPTGKYIGLYTSEQRAQTAFDVYHISRVDFTTVSTQCHGLLKLLQFAYAEDENTHVFVNLGTEDGCYHLSMEWIGYMLERPAPPPLTRTEPELLVDPCPPGNPGAPLGPIRDFLAKTPTVRAAFILGVPPDVPGEPAPARYDFALVMVDPDDKSLEQRVTVMLKALTPLEEEWSVGTLMAPDEAYRQMAAANPPFYAAPGFLAPAGPRPGA